MIKNANKWILISIILLILGILVLPIAAAIPRSGYCGIENVSLKDWAYRLIGLSFPILAIIFSIIGLFAVKKKILKWGFETLIFIIAIFLMYVNIGGFWESINGCSSWDVSIKVEISSLRASAELYASDNNESFTGFCYSTDAKRVEDRLPYSKSKLICNVSDKEWAACAQLIRRTLGPEYYCVDSTKVAKDIKGQCDENWKYTQCPKD